MDHHWVSSSWLSDVGLPQYSQTFQTHLVDGRVLNSLSRRDLEKLLNISDQFHQTSLLLAVQLLQMLSFDREVRARRAKCDLQDRDPIVWTCHREFADNLQGKGIHGALMSLEPSFDTDVMAKALGIPSNKHMLHRHLYEEMRTLASPLRLRANSHSVERSVAFNGSCSSSPKEGRVQVLSRAKGSPVHTYKGVEITNV
uniref:SAM domain-containing protein n=1 Tax=Cynoglossus semilaevis TaxID=244447 RepID=A0A3P8X2I0_CYNSE